MATFEAKKLELTQINGGQEYEQGDFLQSDTINDVVEGTAYAQNVAEAANTTSNKAVSTANSANNTANAASAKVDTFDQRITAAKNTADTAVSNAATAQSTADSATTEINKIKNGTTVVPNANHANNADNANLATKAQQDVNGNPINTTYATVEYVDDLVTEKQGTRVTVNNANVAELSFTSDPQTQITANKTAIAEAQSDISDIIDGSQTVGKATQDANGNVIDKTYAKLPQVVRTDAAQSLTYAQKNTVARNIERSAGRIVNSGEGWYNILTADTNGYFVADLSVTSTYSNQEPTEVKIIAIGGYTIPSQVDTRAAITCFSGGALSPFISKVRVRNSGTQICIDVYIPYNTTTYFNNMQVTLNSWKNISNEMPQVQPFTFISTEDGTDNVSICEVIPNGISTNGQIYQQGAPVFATDPSKLAPSTANGWTQTTATGSLPSAGVYMVSFDIQSGGITGIGILFFDGSVAYAAIGTITGAYVAMYNPSASTKWLLGGSDYTGTINAVYYKRIA